MTFHLATKTLEAINAALEKDQGAAYRGWLGKVIPHIGDAYDPTEKGFRSHLGASLIGRECARDIWYGWRWSTKSSFEGRMLRLFNRGHLEEARFIAMLLMIGCEVYQQDAEGKQYTISHAEGHMGGSGDGIVMNLPDLPAGVAALTEFKTHNDKSFAKLVTDGVREAKPEHYVQMNIYMGKFGIPVALYGAVNKNNDALHLELIAYDQSVCQEYLDRGERIVWMESPPPKIANSIGFYKCKMCNNKAICHLKHKPAVNCRTCRYSQPVVGKEWVCNNQVCAGIIPKEIQQVGCSHYELKECFND